jgi:putative hemolysin
MGLVTLFVILVMVAVNAVLAAYEIALASVSLARLEMLARENRPGAKAALYMKQHIESSLAAIQLGVTLVGAIAAATGGAGAKADISPWLQRLLGIAPGAAAAAAIVMVVVPLTVVTIILGELVPKVFAIRNKEAVCLRLSSVARWFALAVWPAVWVFDTVVHRIVVWGERCWRGDREGERKLEVGALQELRAHAALARASHLIGEREEGMILGAARLSRQPIREIMLPAEHISMLDANATVAASLVTAHMDMHTRFPVTEWPGDPQGIVGYVNFKDIVALMRLSYPHEFSLRNVVRAIPSFFAETPIAVCLERLIRDHAHIALVRDAADRVVGMITLEDILEEIVGDIQDEYDRLPVHLVSSGMAWVAGGGVGLVRLREVTGVDLAADLPPGGARTLSEWVCGHLGGVVHGGEALERGEVRIVVRKVRRQKVLEAQISRLPQTTSSPTM